MRIRTVGLLRCSIYLIFILNYSLFFIVDIPDSISPVLGSWNKGLVGILSSMMGLICFRHYSVIRHKAFLCLYSAICIISVCFVGLLTTESTWFYIIKDCFQFFLILFAIVVYCYLYNNNSVFEIMAIMNYISLIWYVIIIIQEIVFPLTGNFFLKTPILVRNGFLRIDLECFGNVLVLYNFYIVFYGRKKNNPTIENNIAHSIPSREPINYINLILGLLGVYIFQQTRAYVMVITVGILLLLLFVRGNISNWLKSVLVVLALIVLALSTDIVGSFFRRISTKEYSYIARSYAINYYWDVFKRNPLSGFGFARTLSVIRGDQNMASASDVGFIGQMASLGIFSFVIYIPFIIRMIRVSILAYRYDRSSSYVFFAFTYYILATSATLIVLDPPRLLLWPILVGITEREMDRINLFRNHTIPEYYERTG